MMADYPATNSDKVLASDPVTHLEKPTLGSEMNIDFNVSFSYKMIKNNLR